MMILSGCSSVQTSRVIKPPDVLVQRCKYESQPKEYTDRGLAVWSLSLKKALEKCNVKLEALSQWYKEIENAQ